MFFRIVKFLLLVLLAIVVTGYVYVVSKDYLPELLTSRSEIKDQLANLDVNEELAGSVYVTAIKRNQFDPLKPGDLPRPNSFVFDVKSGSFVGTDLNYPVWFISENLATKQKIFVTQPYDVGEEIVPTVFLAHDDQEAIKISNLQGVPSTPVRRLPKLSQSGSYYVNSVITTETTDSNILNIENWGINAGQTDGTGAEVHFANGYGAVWAGNKYILYIKSDGIYAKRFDSLNETLSSELRIIPIDEHALGIYNQIDVSTNGLYLAVSFPVESANTQSKINVYSLDLDSPNPATKVMEITTSDNSPMHWPTFSPGGRYVAMITGHSNEEDNNRLMIYDLISQSFVRVSNFSEFAIDYSFVTDWVN